MVELGVKAVMNNHIYLYEGKRRIQAKGGSIRLRLTGVVARVMTWKWSKEIDRKFKEKESIHGGNM